MIHLCLEQNRPALSSLVVTATDRIVGAGFDEVRASGKEIPATSLERERAAAVERLACGFRGGVEPGSRVGMVGRELPEGG